MTAARIGVVLAGGRATRMGGDKAGAVLAGETLLSRAVGQLVDAGLEPRVCARADTKLPPVSGLGTDAIWREPTSGDDPDDAHPLAGLAYALGQAGESIVALPVDLPLLPPAVLAGLAAFDGRLTVLGADGRPAALVARLGPSYAPALAEAAATGAPALRTLVTLGATILDLIDLAPGVDTSQALSNVNRPDDLRRLAPFAPPLRSA